MFSFLTFYKGDMLLCYYFYLPKYEVFYFQNHLQYSSTFSLDAAAAAR